MLLITAFFASVLTFIYIKLAKNVIRLRRESNISVGHGKSEPLEKAIRAHANFNEYVPLGLILMACLEINNFNTLIITLVGGLSLRWNKPATCEFSLLLALAISRALRPI